MKKEVPEKMYLHLTSGSSLLNSRFYKYMPAKIRKDDKIIEYTRIDTFIERAERYIRSVADGLDKDDDVEAFISGFRQYMKGE